MIPSTDVTTLPAIAAKGQKRSRNGRKRGSMEGVNDVKPFGINAMQIPLFGSHGAGRSVILDVDVAIIVAARFPDTKWVVNQVGGMNYVRSGSGHAGSAANQAGSNPTTTLARFIMGAEAGERVLYKSEDHFDLRRRNLVLEAAQCRKAA